jgi:DNA polymerase I-like protein with 3'-5' exonuclease and polymerase domains
MSITKKRNDLLCQPTIAIDFETFYSKEYSIRDTGNQGYVAHKEFDAYLVSLVGEDIQYVGSPTEAPWENISDSPHFIAHNAGFDSTVFKACQKLGTIPDRIQPVWDCTANLAVYIQAPRSLAGVSEQMFGEKPDKTVRDKMKGRTYESLNDEEIKDLHHYALQDSKLCLKVWDTYHEHWPIQEKTIARHTMNSGFKGVRVDQTLLTAGLAKLREEKQKAQAKIPWAESAPPTSPLQLKKYCTEQGIAAPKSTAMGNEDCDRWEVEHAEKYPIVAALRNWRSSNRLIRLLETIEYRVSNNLVGEGILPFNLKYFGASLTGRWSGDTKVNMQNIPRGEVFGVDVRKMFIPRPGKKFIIADLAQIEPRCLAWWSGDTDLLEFVKQGRDIYEAHALTTMLPVGTTVVDKLTRQLAKTRVLGLGYGCGAKKFKLVAKNMGIEMSEAEAKKVVREYRKSNRKIVDFWKAREKLFLADIGQDNRIQLPSGRWISYFNCKSSRTESGFPQHFGSITRGAPPRTFYGGKLCENLIQATARDVFSDAYYRVLEAGYEIIWTVHDEFIVEVDEDDGEARQAIENLMSITPDWLPGCPIGAEAMETNHYTK